MAREEFLKNLLEQMHDKAMNIRYYEDGFTSENPSDLTLIRETNLKYHKKESDVLIGDFIILTIDQVASGENLVSRFEVEYLFQSYQEGGWNRVWEIINANIELSEKMMKSNVMKLLEENNYETLKEHLFIRPLNYPNCRYDLKDAIYRRIGDIALVLYILISESSEGERHDVSSSKIHRLTAKEWNLSEDEALDAALINTYLMAPPRLYLNPMDTYKPPYQKGAFMALGSEMKTLSNMDIPLLTTTKQTNGAIAIFYPGVQERIAQMYDDDYYVAFTSINEAHLHKVGTISPHVILRNVIKINKMSADQTEVLTKKLYIYKRESGKLEQMDL